MSFNFNWSPLAADANFYQRAIDLLTAALNKPPKPPIIVDDVIVTELNLGTQPPDLDILEIGDIADDRFRGIFKMSYRGDAFLTLRTKVQGNPLNTYLFSTSEFTSPSPLAAQSGLTIPLSITLSDFKLSGFVILVFSKQKGLTIVFRNDPLESLRVSSTFDRISFVRDYLQKTIEDQLRNLFMEELPAVIHRLSLRLWCPEQAQKEGEEASAEGEEQEAAVDPLASPPLDPVDANGDLLDVNDIVNLSLSGAEMPALFSQKNLLKLAALQSSHRTLSVFTPGIRTALWRAAAGWDRPDPGSTPPILSPNVSRTHSFSHGQTHSVTSYIVSEVNSTTTGHLPSRPSLFSLSPSTNSVASGSSMRSRSYMGGKKQKRRIVRTPLRKSKAESGTPSEESNESGDPNCNNTTSVEGPASEMCVTDSIPEEPEDGLEIPEVCFHSSSSKSKRTAPERPALSLELFTEPEPEMPGPIAEPQKLATAPMLQSTKKAEKRPNVSMSPSLYLERSDLLENAWISKMASEIARRVYDEKARNECFWTDQNDVPPPAYDAR